MKKFIKTFILMVCLIVPAMFCLTACGESKTTITSYSLEVPENYTLVDDTLTVKYGETLEGILGNIKVKVVFSDDTTDTYDYTKAKEKGFAFTGIDETGVLNAGEYSFKINYGELAEKTISLAVEKVTIDTSNLIWSENEFTYNGEKQTITITNLPTGITANYLENEKTNAGEYTAVVTFSLNDNNYYLTGCDENNQISVPWKINPKKLTNLELYISNFKFSNTTNSYICSKTLSPANGIVAGDNVTLTIMACRDGQPANGIYQLWYNRDEQGEMEIIACDNNNYTFENGENGCGKTYAFDEFDIENGVTISSPISKYYIIKLDLEAQSSIKYYFTSSNNNISYSLKDENLNDIDYSDGFILTNNTDETKTFVVYLITGSGEQGTLQIQHIHNSVDGKCSLCGFIEETQGLQYEYVSGENPYYKVVGIGTATAKYIRIPATYNDGTHGILAVTTIGNNAFRDKVTTEEEDIFGDNDTIVEVVLSSNIVTIGEYAFCNCKSLENIVMPEGLTTIGSCAFSGCGKLTHVSFPTTIKTIGGIAFGNTGLISVTIPANVTTIDEYTFQCCSNLKSVIFFSGVESIQKCAFSVCSGLETIIIPTSVNKIGWAAFYACSKLSNIFYTGTAEEWAKINIDWSDDYNSCITTDKIYYYTETQPTETGNYWHYENGVPTVWTTTIEE